MQDTGVSETNGHHSSDRKNVYKSLTCYLWSSSYLPTNQLSDLSSSRLVVVVLTTLSDHIAVLHTAII